MARPRIDGMDERIIEAFLSRGTFSSQKEVISEALKALVREQKIKEAKCRSESSGSYEDSTYEQQLKKEQNAPMGNLGRKTAVGKKSA